MVIRWPCLEASPCDVSVPGVSCSEVGGTLASLPLGTTSAPARGLVQPLVSAKPVSAVAPRALRPDPGGVSGLVGGHGTVHFHVVFFHVTFARARSRHAALVPSVLVLQPGRRTSLASTLFRIPSHSFLTRRMAFQLWS